MWSNLASAQGYKLEASKTHSQVDIFLFSQELNLFNFFPLDLTHKGSILAQDFDQIFFDRNNHDHYAVLKFDLQYQGSLGVMDLSETDYVCHGTFTNNRPFSLFTTGIDKNIVKKMCDQINLVHNDVKKNHYSKSFIAYSLLMSSAQAQASCSSNSNVKNISTIKNLSTQFSTEVAIQKLGSCVADILRGSAGVFTGLFDGAKNLLTTSPSKLWQGLKKSASEIKSFVLHLKDEMIKLKNSFSQLSVDLILSIGCNLAGEMITSAGLSALTGAGVAMLSAKIVKTISRMDKLKHLFERLNKLSFLGKGKLAEKVLSCGLK